MPSPNDDDQPNWRDWAGLLVSQVKQAVKEINDLRTVMNNQNSAMNKKIDDNRLAQEEDYREILKKLHNLEISARERDQKLESLVQELIITAKVSGKEGGTEAAKEVGKDLTKNITIYAGILSVIIYAVALVVLKIFGVTI